MPNCDRCGRERAESLLAWNRESYSRVMAEDDHDRLAVGRTCARDMPNRGGFYPDNATWDCDRATVARLKILVAEKDECITLYAEENEELKSTIAKQQARIAELETGVVAKVLALGAKIVELERENAELRADVDALGICQKCDGSGVYEPRSAHWDRENQQIVIPQKGTCQACSGTGRVERARRWRPT
ncbi:MAG TPA: hypothetical protein VFZ21_30855 [Gemmatimonadaceae bacterium]|nr:hypothetical protein [Gemmatimonadaceae bacterium]